LLEGLAYYEELSQVFGQSDALGALSTIAMIQGHFADAERFARQGLKIVPETIRYQQAYLLPLLGFAQFHLGLFAEAETAVTAAINMHLEYGGVDIATANIVARLTHILLHQGKYTQVIQQIDAARSNASRAGQSTGIRLAMEYIHPWMHGAVTLAQGHYAEAYIYLEQALAGWTPVAYGRYDRVSLIASLALALRGLGRNDEARVQLAAALDDALGSRAYFGLLIALTVAALFKLDQENTVPAVDLYATVAAQPLVSHSIWYNDIAGKTIAEAAGQLPAELVATARHKGEKAGLWEAGQALADSLAA
jgi:tetratricopeptide (TPR) repeat protein